MSVWPAIALGLATLSVAVTYFVMRASAEVRLARQREELASARAELSAQRDAMADSIRTAEEAVRRKAMDEFLADIRIEERHYIREHKAFFLTRKAVVRQERIFFRNIPLSNWIEQEHPFEEGADAEGLARTMSVFLPEGLFEEAVPINRRIRA